MTIPIYLRDSGVDFIAVEMPRADKFTIGIMALVAAKERDMISQRTRDGLAAARRREIKLGNPRPAQALKVAQTANLASADAYANTLLPVIQEIRAAHVKTLRRVVDLLKPFQNFSYYHPDQHGSASIKAVLPC